MAAIHDRWDAVAMALFGMPFAELEAAERVLVTSAIERSEVSVEDGSR